jgi:hypothetical protein
LQIAPAGAPRDSRSTTRAAGERANSPRRRDRSPGGLEVRTAGRRLGRRVMTMTGGARQVAPEGGAPAPMSMAAVQQPAPVVIHVSHVE